MKKCCFCLTLINGVRSIGAILFTLTLTIFVFYLVFIEYVRLRVLENLYGIIPCSQPRIDIIIDSLFEYSLLANTLLLIVCTTGCTRWLLVPWLTIYALDILTLIAISMYLFIFPMPLISENRMEHSLLRGIGLIPLLLAVALTYCWMVVRALYTEMNESGTNDNAPSASMGPVSTNNNSPKICCPLKLRMGVQILGGILTIVSLNLLIAHYLKLDDVIADKYERLFGEKPAARIQVMISSSIVLCIFVNILVIFGGSGGRWRRALLLPWLIVYGFIIMGAIGAHQWFTTLCWVEEKVYGLVCLITGFLGLVLWTLVWLVAAEASEKPKLLIARNPLGFQRL
ncbi:uncharacterized protein [Lepeophtheirus salmonis]|uniref:Uncharacterized protein n=1 Tax=Lepeophtheirus salmonis TaxID=72036 RepID=A0A0K2U1P2_LEPSM|nr:uncharacterized protein LOC121114619 [Lepeophtheirus salmonis]